METYAVRNAWEGGRWEIRDCKTREIVAFEEMGSMKTFTKNQLEAAKRRLLEKCRGKLSITPIETTNVECIIDLFLKELR